jgi:hypothetical protein
MIASFDHRPMLTATLALSTSVLIVVVITLSTLLITLPQTASAPGRSDGGNPTGPAPKVMDAESYGEVYGWNIQAGGENKGYDIYRASRTGDSGKRHHKIVGDYLPAGSGLR